MNKYYNNRYRMLKKFEEVCEENKTDLYTITNFQALHQNLKTTNTNLETTIQIQIRDTKPTTEYILQIKIKMSDTLYRLQRKCLPYARLAKNDDLTGRISNSKYFIERARIGYAIARAKEIEKVINDNLSTFISITPQDLTTMATVISNYYDVTQKTGEEMSKKQGSGTKMIPILIKEGMTTVENLFDMCYGEFAEAKPELVNILDAAKEIYDIGIHHTAVILTITEKGTNKKLKEVLVLIKELNKTTTSNITGTAKFEKIKHGIFTFIFTKEGYITYETIITVKQGKTIEMTVEMEKA